MLVVYELHLFRNHDWKIDSVFDDRDLAVMEAQQIERSREYPGVRVVEEICDQFSSRILSSRTIYRSNKIEARQTAAPRSGGAEMSMAGASWPMAKSGSSDQTAPQGSRKVPVFSWLAIAGVLVCGLGAFYAFSGFID